MKGSILLILFFSLGSLICQNNTATDSMLVLLKTQKEDTNKVKVLYQLSEECDVKDILKYAEPSLELAEKLNYKKGIADALNNIGYFYSVFNQPEEALKYYTRSLKIQQEIRNKPGIASVSHNFAIIYSSYGQIKKATDFYIASLKIKEELGDKAGIARSLNGLGNMCQKQEQNQEALDYFIKALKIQEEINDEAGTLSTYTNIADLYFKAQLFEKALDYYNKVFALSEKLSDKEAGSKALLGLGGIYEEKGRPEIALEYYLKAKKISEAITNKRGIAYSLINIGGIYLKQKKYRQAELYLNQALSLGKELGEAKIRYVSSTGLSSVYAETARYDLAYQMQVASDLIEDSLYSAQVQQSVIKSQMSYEFQKKEAAIIAEQDKKDAVALERSKIKDLQIFSLIGILVLALVIGWLFFRQNKLRTSQRTMQLEQKLLRSQMNPHFIFNSLNSIHSVVLSGDKTEAAKYLASFAKLIRTILESSRFELITLEKEIALLENYIKLQMLRFDNDLSYTIDIDPALDQSTTLVPPMLTQPFLENAIEHGFFENGHKGELKLSFKKEGEFLHVSVTDNGRGINENKTTEQHISMATGITRERLQLLNNKRNKKTSFNISEAFPMNKEYKGVKVSFNIPLELV